MNDYCEIVVKGHLDKDWSGWYDGLTITHNDRGETLFSGWLRDQAPSHGLLAKMRDLGLVLISLTYQANESLRENDDPHNDP
jgi:hypothetical protein